MSLQKPVWTPLPDSGRNLKRFIQLVNREHGLDFRDYHSLWKWSADPKTAQLFWLSLYKYLEIQGDGVPTPTLRQLQEAEQPRLYPPPEFFPGVQLNFAENMFTHYNPNEVILHTVEEGGHSVQDIKWIQLRTQVERVADAMAGAGVSIGDRVAAVISNRLETIVCCLATLSLGAIWSSSSPDMGVDAILSRLVQIRPKLVFCESQVLYNNKIRPLVSKHLEWEGVLREKNPELRHVVLLGQQNTDVTKFGDARRKFISWSGFLCLGIGRKLTFQRLPFNHPGFIVYSSGTSGAPKCIVHSAGGLLMQVRKDGLLSYDVRAGDTVLQYTTTAWIMWSMVLVSLSYGSKVVVYNGSPMVPDDLVLLRLVQRLKVTLLGTSAKFLSLLKDKKIRAQDLVDLSSLRTVTSTGSTLTTDVAEWFYKDGFPSHVHLLSTCGGTDLACSLLTGYATLPFYAGEIQAPALGMAVDILDIDSPEGSPGKSIKGSGVAGELVATELFPSQPVFFWNDPTGKRYKGAYFERYGTRVWSQGDFVSMNPVTGGFITHGRSDGVLNPAGVRFGSAEIYNVIEKDTEIEDSLCIGQRRPQDPDEVVLLFVVMKPGHSFSAQVVERLRSEISRRLSVRHVPKYIFEIEDIPYTVNGKKVEIVVKRIVSGVKSVVVSPTIAHPECLQLYRRFENVEEADAAQRKKFRLAAL